MTLKQELQKIVDKDLLNKHDEYICNNLSDNNKLQFYKYKGLASKYASQYYYGGTAWWEYNWQSYNYIILEKYRFIKDVIKLLEQEEKQNQ